MLKIYTDLKIKNDTTIECGLEEGIDTMDVARGVQGGGGTCPPSATRSLKKIDEDYSNWLGIFFFRTICL